MDDAALGRPEALIGALKQRAVVQDDEVARLRAQLAACETAHKRATAEKIGSFETLERMVEERTAQVLTQRDNAFAAVQRANAERDAARARAVEVEHALVERDARSAWKDQEIANLSQRGYVEWQRADEAEARAEALGAQIVMLREAMFDEIPANAGDGTAVPDVIWKHCRGCGRDVNRDTHFPTCWVAAVLAATSGGAGRGEGA